MAHILMMIAQRLALGVFTMFIVSVIIFMAVELLPGDVVESLLGAARTEATVEAFRRQLGLEQPAYVRYFTWLGDILQGNLGVSLATQRPIDDLVLYRLWNTMFLAAYAASIAVPIALTFGILAALYRNSFFDRTVNVAALTGISSPEFLAAYILIFIFAVQLGWFPTLARVSLDMPMSERLYVLLLPAVTLSLVTVAHMMRMTRASIINLMASPYIEMARLKGVRNSTIILRHALPNAIAPIVNVVAINLAYLIVGVVVVEVVFVYPGLGQLMVDSVANRDMPIVQIACLIFAVTYISLNLLADICSILSNPRLLHPR